MEMVAQLHVWDTRERNYRCREMYHLLPSADVLLRLNVDGFSSGLYDFNVFDGV